jgi:hypothetical protein
MHVPGEVPKRWKIARSFSPRRLARSIPLEFLVPQARYEEEASAPRTCGSLVPTMNVSLRDELKAFVDD